MQIRAPFRVTQANPLWTTEDMPGRNVMHHPRLYTIHEKEKEGEWCGAKAPSRPTHSGPILADFKDAWTALPFAWTEPDLNEAYSPCGSLLPGPLSTPPTELFSPLRNMCGWHSNSAPATPRADREQGSDANSSRPTQMADAGTHFPVFEPARRFDLF